MTTRWDTRDGVRAFERRSDLQADGQATAPRILMIVFEFLSSFIHSLNLFFSRLLLDQSTRADAVVCETPIGIDWRTPAGHGK